MDGNRERRVRNVKKEIKARKKRIQYSWDDKLFMFIVYAVAIIITFLCIYPLYFTLIASFSDAYDVYTGKVSFLPSGFTTKAYEAVFTNRDIWRGYGNTIFYTVAGTAFNLALTIPTAYALSKKRMFGRSFLTILFLITMYFSGGMIPTYLLYDKLGLLNTPWVMIVSGGISVYNVVITRTYFQNSIPETLYEAARIDGASEFRIFWKLVIPLSAPIIAVIGLYYAVGHWSSYFTAMIYLTDETLHPLQSILRRILILNESAYEAALEGDLTAEMLASAQAKSHLATTMKYALVFIGSAPMLIIYPFIQKFFVKGVMVGSLKG